MATLAFFLTLTGAAVAAPKLLTAGDQISQGDLAGSTYGSPAIAPGKVTNAKLANPSLTLTAGTGLAGGGAIALGGSGALSVDPATVQSRVSGTCSSGALSKVNENGTVDCTTALRAYGYIDGAGTPSVDASKSSGIEDVAYFSGIYCVVVDPSICRRRSPSSRRRTSPAPSSPRAPTRARQAAGQGSR